MFENLAITPFQAIVFGLLTLPISIWVIYTDIRTLKIKNEAVIAMLAVFVVAGVFVLPFSEYLWRYLAFAIALVIGIVLWLAVKFGAGDMKYIASAAPFVATPDWDTFAALFVIWSIVVLIIRLLATRSGALRAKYPNWVWLSQEGRKAKVPMALGLAPTLTSYFLLGAMG